VDIWFAHSQLCAAQEHQRQQLHLQQQRETQAVVKEHRTAMRALEARLLEQQLGIHCQYWQC